MQIEDIEAIHDYFLRTSSKTPAAETIKLDALKFYETGSFWDRNMSSDWSDQFRTKRNQFNIANAVTNEEKAIMTRTLETGMTTEEMQGKPRPKIDVKTGAVGSAIKAAMPLSSAGQPVLSRVLKKGLNGDDVKAWQTFLGLTPATGYFDGLTDSKTRAFQSSHRLVVDGAVGKNTWKAAFPIATSPDMAASPDGASTATMFAPTANAPSFSPPPNMPKTQRSAPKQSPQTSNSPPAASVASKPSIITAGLDPSKWSTGAKVIGGLAAVALAGGAIMSHQEKGSRHHR